jgi:hypothetical protein
VERYDRVFQWCLPRYGDDDEISFEFQAASKDMKLYDKAHCRWLDSIILCDKVITAHHVARFHGACLS